MNPRFIRLAERERPPITLHIDGAAVRALTGDTVMTALLTGGATLRQSEFGDGARAGFCLMGACQDCWVWTDDGDRLRACSTMAIDGARIRTTQPEGAWPSHG